MLSEFYALAAQVIPVFLLAIALEVRVMLEPIRDFVAHATFRQLVKAARFAVIGITLNLNLMLVGEGVALWAVATGRESELITSLVALALALGALMTVALIVGPLLIAPAGTVKPPAATPKPPSSPGAGGSTP